MTTNHLDDQLDDYVLGALTPELQTTCDEHLATCARCRMEVDEMLADFTPLALATVPVLPSAALRTRLLATVESEGRFDDFVDAMARLTDLGRDAAKGLLDAIDDATRWMMGPADGVSLFHIGGGPSTADAIVGFVRIAPGAAFPPHAHVGDEAMLVLQGSYRDLDASGAQVAIHRRGETVRMAAQSQHKLEALPGPDLVYLVVAMHGITFGDDDLVGPDDPRM